MPLWKIYHPTGAYTEEDKKEFSAAVTSMYAKVPIPEFYVVCIFEEMPPATIFVGGERDDNFVRIKVDQIARTMAGGVVRDWWVHTLDNLYAPWVRDRGYNWELSIDETPFDLWTLQGIIPPPFESAGEQRWIKENKASEVTEAEKLPPHAKMFNRGVYTEV
ncbi:MAG: tautomerase family protein [Sporichthyaceae bacterium]